MKKCLFVFLILLLASGSYGRQKKETREIPVQVMTYNIRMDNRGDGNNQWKYRRDYAAALIRFYSPDLFGAQEVLHNQLTDLQERLPGYAFIGVGREDGKTKGEYTPVFYKTDRFKLIDSGNFWLAEDKHAVGKKGWDAACERVATWGIFEDLKTGKRFFFLNTHLDHMGKTARHRGAELILEETDRLRGDYPALVTGDFNAVPGDDPIRVLTDPADRRHLVDSRSQAAVRYGPEGTFHNFGRIPFERRERIDYIFFKGKMRVGRSGILAESMGALYPSDHHPVLAAFVLE